MHRVFVFRAEPDAPVQAFVNPVLEWTGSETETDEEGCLSIPGVWIDVERPRDVRMRGFDARGRERVVEATELEARVLQHELDHLDGVLLLDRAAPEQRRAALRALRGP
jgi:peptide deformylase